MDKNDREITPFPPEDPSAMAVHGEPIDSWEQVNKYGTYEVQDTTDTDNVFPCIGPEGAWQGCLELPDAVKDKERPRKVF